MRKIKWKFSSNTLPAYTKIGCVNISIYLDQTSLTKKRSWQAYVWIGGIKTIVGPNRLTLDRAKKDSIRLVGQYLLDHHACLISEMKKFDLLEEDHTAKTI